MSYTVITGASAGIGAEFAKQLAQTGNDLILVARRKDKLDSLASELREKHGVKVSCFAVDLAEPAGSEILATEINIANLPVNGLINNAGFGDRGNFVDLTLQRQMQMIQLNVNTLVELTHRLLPNMLKQPKPYIINVASIAAFQAGPNMAIYYATKAFVLSFSEALYEELKSKGVAVSALCPGPTLSEFADQANLGDSNLFKAGAMTSAEVAKQALANRNSAIVITGWKNQLSVGLGKFSPRFMTRKIAGWLQA
jgi:short-subunit dehydrogenase